MKALTLTQPWATLLVTDAPYRKVFETRGWATNYRGLLAIHAAKGFPKSAQDFAAEERALGRLPARLPLGAIVGIVRLVDVYKTEELREGLGPLERRYGDYTWGRYAWCTELVATLEQPIGAVGALGLWSLPESLNAMLERIAGVRI